MIINQIAITDVIAFNALVDAYASSAATDPLVALSLARTAATAIFLAVGPLFGLSRDVFEKEDVGSRNTVKWFFRKGYRFMSAGGLIVFIVIGPPIALFVIGLLLPEMIRDALTFGASVFTIVWGFLSTGFFLMVMPLVAENTNVLKSLTISFRMVRQNLKRVFSVWTYYFAFLIIYTIPIVLWATSTTAGLLDPQGIISLIFLVVWIIGGIFTLLLTVLPAGVNSINHIYRQLKTQIKP
jgi:hypothetical protein